MKSIVGGLLACGLVCSASADNSPLIFNLLSGFPDQDRGAAAHAVSGDGTLVGGESELQDGREAFTWTLAGGYLPQGDVMPDPFVSSIRALSTDGTRGAGLVTLGQVSQTGSGGGRAARWSDSSGFTQLGLINQVGQATSIAYGISGDGSTVVGSSSSTAGMRAFAWTSGGGMVNLGYLAGSGSGGSSSVANDASQNGSVVVGTSGSGATSRAFKWTSAAQMVAIGGAGTGANAVTADGSMAVGFGSSGTEGMIFINSGSTSVGDLPGGNAACELLDVTPDGSLAVGYGTAPAGTEAVIWDATHGLRPLSQILSDAGMNLSFIRLLEVSSISDDGDVLVGNCVSFAGKQQGWVLSGLKDLLAGDTPSDVRYPVPVSLTVSVANGLSLGSNTLAVVTADGPEAPSGTVANLVSGSASKPLYLLKGATYTISAALGSWDGQREDVVTIDGPFSLTYVLDGDTDGDGLLDSEELQLGTKVDQMDTDGDGLNDYDEARIHLTNPKSKDTDRDGASDFAEIQAGTNPLDKASKPVAVSITIRLAKGIVTSNTLATLDFDGQLSTVALVRGMGRATVSTKTNTTHTVSASMGALTSGSPVALSITTRPGSVNLTLDGDGDNDGLLDSEEAKAKGDPNNPDTDGDGISDGDEVKLHGTKVYLADSDNDGFTDTQEISLGTDPKSSRSVPQAFIERQVTMDLGFRYVDPSGNARDEAVDTNAFIKWLSAAAGSQRNSGTLWMQYKLDGTSLRWLIRGPGGELDVTRVMAASGLKTPNTFDAVVVQDHAAGDPFHVDRSSAYKVVGRNAPSMTFVISGRSHYQSLILPITNLRIDLATATGTEPYLLQGTVVDASLTGKLPGILYGNVNLSAEVADVEGTKHTLP